MNKLLRAVEDYLDDEREYVRFAEREIQVLEQKARDERRQAQRSSAAALYWRAGHCHELAVGYAAMREHEGAFALRSEAYALESAAKAMEAAL